MAKTLRVESVPDDPLRILKARATLTDMSLPDYVLHELRQLVERPTQDELRQRIESRRPVTPRIAPADLLDEERTYRNP